MPVASFKFFARMRDDPSLDLVVANAHISPGTVGALPVEAGRAWRLAQTSGR